MKRNQWAAVLLALLLFCCGVLVGGLADHFYTVRVVNAKSAEDFRLHYVSEMRTRLKMTPAQVSELEKILDDTKARVKAVRDSYHPEMLKIKAEQITQVKSILTPQQVPEYERMVAEHEQHAREQEERDRREEQKRAAAAQSQAGH